MTKTIKSSPSVRRWLLLALAAVASIASFITTVQGTLALFPSFDLSRGAAIGLAIVFQAALLFIPFEFGMRTHKPSRTALALVVALAWLFSTTTSFLCIHSAFTADQSSAERQFFAWRSTQTYLAEVQSVTTHALEQVKAASLELQRKIQQEVDLGGGLIRFVNPHLNSLANVQERDLPFDKNRIIPGPGLRAAFLQDLTTQLQSERQALEESLAALTQSTQKLNELQEADPATLLAFLNSATRGERRYLVETILGDEKLPDLDAAAYEPIETSRKWALGVHRLGQGDPTAVGMLLIAFALDFFIVALSWAAGVADDRTDAPPRRRLARLFREAYGFDNYLSGARRWWNAVEAELVHRSRTWYPVRIDLLAEESDFIAQENLQREGILRVLSVEGGEDILVISEKAHRQLRELVLGRES